VKNKRNPPTEKKEKATVPASTLPFATPTKKKSDQNLPSSSSVTVCVVRVSLSLVCVVCVRCESGIYRERPNGMAVLPH